MGEYAFLAVYRSSYGMSTSDLWAKGNGMLEAWLILAVEWVVFMALAWYLEQVRFDTTVSVRVVVGGWGGGGGCMRLHHLAGLRRAPTGI